MCLVKYEQGFEAVGNTGDNEPYSTAVYAKTITTARGPVKSTGSISH